MADTGLTEATIPPQTRREPIEREAAVAWPTPADNPDLAPPPPPASQDRVSVDPPTAAPPPEDTAAAAEPVIVAAPTEDPAASQDSGNPTATPYQYDPQVMAEHALLGSLLHSPAAFGTLEEFLGPRDFATSETRQLYLTLHALHRRRALHDAAALPTPQAQLAAAEDNHQKLRTALRAGLNGPRLDPAAVDRVISRVITAAPPEALPFRGVYDPAAQLRLGRMVLEDSLRRQLHQMGVQLTPATSTTSPREPRQAAQTAHAVAANLTSMLGHLDTLAARLARAVQRTGPDTTTSAPVEGQSGRRIRWPDLVRPLATPLRHRAERQLIHLALHAGRLDHVPEQILALTPEDFADRRHANTWRLIQDLRSRGLPVNYVSVLYEAHTHGTAQPILPGKALAAMATPPETRPDRIARALHTVVTAALARVRHDSQRTIAAAARNPQLPAQQALNHTRQALSGLADRARAAAEAHTHLAQHDTTRRTR